MLTPTETAQSSQAYLARCGPDMGHGYGTGVGTCQKSTGPMALRLVATLLVSSASDLQSLAPEPCSVAHDQQHERQQAEAEPEGNGHRG
jgi:hypothetical protein